MAPLQEQGQNSIKSTLSPVPNIGPSHFQITCLKAISPFDGQREESRATVSHNSLRSPIETDSLLAGYQISCSGLNLENV